MELTMIDKKYVNGKIYAVRSPNYKLYYLGSTILPLGKRFYFHKKNPANTSAIEVMKHGSSYIELFENYPCKNRFELEQREGELQRKYKKFIVNKNIAGRTAKQLYQDKKHLYVERNKKYSKQYQKDNVESIKKQRKEHYDKNVERILADKKKRYAENYEKILAKAKIYREKNREKLRLQAKAYREKKKQKNI